MGLTLEEKANIRQKVQQGLQPKVPVPTLGALEVQAKPSDPHPAIRTSPQQEEVVIDITGDNGSYSFTLRPSDISRLRGRYGRGPAFEKWLGERIRDLLVSFGGG